MYVLACLHRICHKSVRDMMQVAQERNVDPQCPVCSHPFKADEMRRMRGGDDKNVQDITHYCLRCAKLACEMCCGEGHPLKTVDDAYALMERNNPSVLQENMDKYVATEQKIVQHYDDIIKQAMQRRDTLLEQTRANFFHGLPVATKADYQKSAAELCDFWKAMQDNPGKFCDLYGLYANRMSQFLRNYQTVLVQDREDNEMRILRKHDVCSFSNFHIFKTDSTERVDENFGSMEIKVIIAAINFQQRFFIACVNHYGLRMLYAYDYGKKRVWAFPDFKVAYNFRFGIDAEQRLWISHGDYTHGSRLIRVKSTEHGHIEPEHTLSFPSVNCVTRFCFLENNDIVIIDGTAFCMNIDTLWIFPKDDYHDHGAPIVSERTLKISIPDNSLECFTYRNEVYILYSKGIAVLSVSEQRITRMFAELGDTINHMHMTITEDGLIVVTSEHGTDKEPDIVTVWNTRGLLLQQFLINDESQKKQYVMMLPPGNDLVTLCTSSVEIYHRY